MLISCAFSLLATNAFAAATLITSDGGAGASTVLQGFKASKLVTVAVNAETQSYGAAADHANGTRVFGTISGDPLIYFQDKAEADIGTTKAADLIGGIDGSDSTALSSWTSL